MKTRTPSHVRMRTILKEAREQRGLSQKALSKKLGRYPTFVCKYENGDRRLDVPEFNWIANELQMDTANAVREIGPMYGAEQRDIPTAGYSGTPLAKKLGITSTTRLLVVEPPSNYAALLEPLPDGARFTTRIAESTTLVHAFVTARSQLHALLKTFRAKLKPDAAIWISWPKKASKQPTDITEDAVREAALPLGLVDIKVCAVDEVWSGLKLVVRKKLR